jgi:hypothetical protein
MEDDGGELEEDEVVDKAILDFITLSEEFIPEESASYGPENAGVGGGSEKDDGEDRKERLDEEDKGKIEDIDCDSVSANPSFSFSSIFPNSLSI